MLFSASDTASQPVAGVPAAARVVREAALAGVAYCRIAAPGGYAPDAFTSSEVERLRGSMAVEFLSEAAALDGAQAAVSGEALPDCEAIRAALGAPLPADPAVLRHGGGKAGLREEGRRIVRATAKPGDGIISRSINRPVSQAITRAALHFYPALQPIHATWGTALLGLAMAASFLTGTEAGLIAGALLFQAASVFDGVDGEIARAAFRSTPQGARIDSLVDAVTNLGFIAGVTLNVWLQGERLAGFAGAAGLTLFGLGLWLIGQREKSADGSLTFNGVKEHFARRPSRIRQWLTWLTMRDFFALAGAIFIVTGHAVPGLLAFAVVAGGWFMVVALVTARHAA